MAREANGLDEVGLRRILTSLRNEEPTFTYGSQEIARAICVLRLLRESDHLPDTAAALAPYIAPTVCASREDQALFHRRFTLLVPSSQSSGLAGLLLGLPLVATIATGWLDGGLTGVLMAGVLGRKRPAPTPPPETEAGEFDRPSRSDRTVVGIFWARVIFWSVVAILLTIVFINTEDLWSSNVPSDVTPKQQGPTGPFTPRDAPAPPPYVAWVRHVLMGVSPIAIALLALWLRRQRKARLVRGFTTRRFDEAEVRFGQPHDGHLDRRVVARALPALRRPMPTSTEVFDVRGSIAAAVSEPGKTEPRMHHLLREPEVLLLFRLDGAADHASRVARDFARRLREVGATVTAYESIGTGDRLRPRPDLSNHLVPLNPDRDGTVALAAAVNDAPKAILFFFGDGRGLESGADAPAESAAFILSSYQARAILTPAPMSEWGLREQALEAAGYIVVPADSAGIAGLMEWVIDHDREDVAPMTTKLLRRQRAGEISRYGRYPRLLIGSATRFLSQRPPTPELTAQLIAQLRKYLGEIAFSWLCALAVYPRIVPDLTRELGRRLYLEDSPAPLFSEHGYLALSRLPWVLRGAMPDWLRAELIGQVTTSFAAKVQQELRNLLICPNGDGGIALGIVERSGIAWNEVFDALAGAAPKTSELHDQVFLKFMAADRALAVAVPNRLQRLLGSAHLRVETWAALACVALSVGLLAIPPDALYAYLGDWLKVAAIAWPVAFLLLPLWNAWTLTRAGDRPTREGMIFSLLAMIAAFAFPYSGDIGKVMQLGIEMSVFVSITIGVGLAARWVMSNREADVGKLLQQLLDPETWSLRWSRLLAVWLIGMVGAGGAAVGLMFSIVEIRGSLSRLRWESIDPIAVAAVLWSTSGIVLAPFLFVVWSYAGFRVRLDQKAFVGGCALALSLLSRASAMVVLIYGTFMLAAGSLKPFASLLNTAVFPVVGIGLLLALWSILGVRTAGRCVGRQQVGRMAAYVLAALTIVGAAALLVWLIEPKDRLPVIATVFAAILCYLSPLFAVMAAGAATVVQGEELPIRLRTAIGLGRAFLMPFAVAVALASAVEFGLGMAKGSVDIVLITLALAACVIPLVAIVEFGRALRSLRPRAAGTRMGQPKSEAAAA